MNDQISSSEKSNTIGIPRIQERGVYSVENFLASCWKLSELPDGILFLRLASKDDIIYYDFSNAIKKDHYSIAEKNIYSKETSSFYSPPIIGRISEYIFALFGKEEKKWLAEDLEWKSRRYVFSMRIKDWKIEKIIKEKCVKRSEKSNDTQKKNASRIRNILGSSISKLPTLIR